MVYDADNDELTPCMRHGLVELRDVTRLDIEYTECSGDGDESVICT